MMGTRITAPDLSQSGAQSRAGLACANTRHSRTNFDHQLHRMNRRSEHRFLKTVCHRFFWLLLTLPINGIAFSQTGDALPTPRLLSPVETPPVFVRNTKDFSQWPTMIKAGIDEARAHFGNYGPVFVYIAGHQDRELNSKAFHRRLTAEYCRHRHPTNKDKYNACLNGAASEIIKKAMSGRGDAYLSTVENANPPIAELVFINPHEFHAPYLYTRGIHEYTHVFQRSFPRTPTWMMEGGAEFFASYLGDKRGWANFRHDMIQYLQNVKRIPDPAIGIRDMEDVDKASPEIRKYYRHLAYDAGAWAFAFMIHHSKSQRVSDVTKSLYPQIAKRGWEAALPDYVNMKDKDMFYQKFTALLQQPLDQQLKMLNAIKD